MGSPVYATVVQVVKDPQGRQLQEQNDKHAESIILVVGRIFRTWRARKFQGVRERIETNRRLAPTFFYNGPGHLVNCHRPCCIISVARGHDLVGEPDHDEEGGQRQRTHQNQRREP